MKISVQYSTLIVKSLEESVPFYRDILGFKEGYHVDLPVGAITIMHSPDGACVELIESPRYEVGLYSIGTDVDNLDETVAHLRKNGYEILGKIIPTTVGRQAFVLDPNGVRLCLIEHTEEYKRKYMQSPDPLC